MLGINADDGPAQRLESLPLGLNVPELAISLREQNEGGNLAALLAVVFIAISTFFVYRSFYGMRIQQ